jgi:hypothetical protein
MLLMLAVAVVEFPTPPLLHQVELGVGDHLDHIHPQTQ